MDSPLIRIEDLGKKYPGQNGRWAVENLNLIINPGQLFGLIGPDGAGKSTTLRVLGTVIQPTHGEVWINGFNIINNPEKIRPHIGYMPQLFSLYPDLTVNENLNFFAEINQVKKADKITQIEKMLAFTNLGEFRNRQARNLSGGMKKKLALGCSLVHNPNILILDEPSTGVDPVSRRELWRLLSEVVDQGITVILSTPYMDEADRCNQVAILYEGKVIVQGKPAELKSELPFEIVEVKTKPRKAARQTIERLNSILDWRPVGDRFRISVGKGKTRSLIRFLNEEFSTEKAEVRILRKSLPLMEDVFTYHVKAQRH